MAINWIKDTFKTHKPIIAMCHLQPMPGDPYYDKDGGMNKVMDTLEAAIHRARTVAAPTNQQRFLLPGNPCTVTGSCADCKSETCICNHIVVTRHCRPVGRIQFILVGEELGF